MPGIKELETEISNRVELIELLENKLSIFEDSYYLEVQQSNLFTNDKTRKIELKRRLNLDEEYISISKDLSLIKKLQSTSEIELAAMKRQFIRQFCQVRLYGAI